MGCVPAVLGGAAADTVGDAVPRYVDAQYACMVRAVPVFLHLFAVSGHYYRVVDVGTNQKFQLFAHLENSKDQDCLGGNCQNPAVPAGVTCGSGIRCNFAVVSPNTAPTE